MLVDGYVHCLCMAFVQVNGLLDLTILGFGADPSMCASGCRAMCNTVATSKSEVHLCWQLCLFLSSTGAGASQASLTRLAHHASDPVQPQLAATLQCSR